MHGLRNRGFAAGKTLGRFRAGALRSWQPRLARHRPVQCRSRCTNAIVPTDWVDYNGHTNDSRYMQITSEAGDRFMRLIGVDEPYLAIGSLVLHRREPPQLHRPEPRRRSPLRHGAADVARRQAFAHLHGRARHDDDSLVATAEHMMLHVDATAGKSSPASPRDPGQARRDRRAARLLPPPGPSRPGDRPTQTLTEGLRPVGRPTGVLRAPWVRKHSFTLVAALSHVVGVTPRSRSSDFSTFSVGVRGKRLDDVDVARHHVPAHPAGAERDQLRLHRRCGRVERRRRPSHHPR